MGSSNRHWPSMFKSKPCNHHHHHHNHQWQHDVNPSPLLSSGCHRAPYSSGPASEERTPEPKPRWNPKPEQIRILEAIFNSGMVNPPRDEIRKIRVQLQEYGQVGDANVFYWFQNRKSRSKHKQRHLQTTKQQISTAAAAPSSSSSSSEKSSPKPSMLNSPTASVNQTYFQTDFMPENFFFPAGYCYPEVGSGPSIDQTAAGNCSGDLLSELVMMSHHHHEVLQKKVEDDKLKLQPQQQQQQLGGYALTTTSPTASHHYVAPTTTGVTVPSTISHNLGVGESATVGPLKSTVFINDVAFEVSVGPFNVREAFGDDAVLVHSYGQPVVTNEWGVTLQSLQHGGFYYLLRTLAPITASETQLLW